MSTVDKLVGSKLRERREQLGMERMALARLVSLSDTLIRDYEAGSSRVGARRLQQIATALDVPVSYFFDDGNILAAASDPQALELLNAFASIDDPDARRSLTDVAKAMSRASEPAPAPLRRIN